MIIFHCNSVIVPICSRAGTDGALYTPTQEAIIQKDGRPISIHGVSSDNAAGIEVPCGCLFCLLYIEKTTR